MRMTNQLVYPENSCLAGNVLSPEYALCKYFFRAEQVDTDDSIANIAAGAIGAGRNTGTDPMSAATLWTNDGYATVGGAAGRYCTLAAAAHDVSLVDTSLVWTLRIKKVTAAFPGTEQIVIGGYQGGAPGGIKVAVTTAGRLRWYIDDTANNEVSVFSAAGTPICDNATAHDEHSFVLMLPKAGSSSAFLGQNGLASGSSAATSIQGHSLAGGNTMKIGSPITPAVIDAYQLAAFACYQIPSNTVALTPVRDRIMDWAYRHPASPIPDWVFGT